MLALAAAQLPSLASDSALDNATTATQSVLPQAASSVVSSFRSTPASKPSSAGVAESASKTAGLFQCEICAYNTSKKSSLTAHKRIHSGEKPFACKQCDYRAFVKG